MRQIVLPILEQREAVSFHAYGADGDEQPRPTRGRPPSRSPHNALGWPVFDREGRLIAVAVAMNHYVAEQEGEARARGRQYAAFGAEEERQLVNLCSKVRDRGGRGQMDSGHNLIAYCVYVFCTSITAERGPGEFVPPARGPQLLRAKRRGHGNARCRPAPCCDGRERVVNACLIVGHWGLMKKVMSNKLRSMVYSNDTCGAAIKQGNHQSSRSPSLAWPRPIW